MPPVALSPTYVQGLEPAQVEYRRRIWFVPSRILQAELICVGHICITLIVRMLSFLGDQMRYKMLTPRPIPLSTSRTKSASLNFAIHLR